MRRRARVGPLSVLASAGLVALLALGPSMSIGDGDGALPGLRIADREAGANPAPVAIAGARQADPPGTRFVPWPARAQAELHPVVRSKVLSRPRATSGSGGSGGGSGGGGSVPTTGWRWPLIGAITQYFSASHQGIDILGGTGDAVVAAHGGTVVGVGWLTSCGGLQIHIDVGGAEAWYQHLSATQVSVGQVVSAGTRIGRVGSTGCATGPHLHFGIRVNSTFVNPLPYLPAR